MSSFTWPPEGGGGVPIYPTTASFPATATTGTLAVDASTGNLYEFNGTSWVQIGGPGSALSLGSLDAQAANAKGAALTGGVLSMQSASATEPGLVNNGSQHFSGTKIFDNDPIIAVINNLANAPTINVEDFWLLDNNGYHTVDWNSDTLTDANDALSINWLNRTLVNPSGTTLFNWDGSSGVLTGSASLNVLTSALGSLTDAGTDGITVTGGTGATVGSVSIAQAAASASQNGYLKSADWSTFNSKGSGTVTAVSVASSNGFTGTSSGGSTPALTLTTSITGVLKGDGTAISAATAGTDYSAGTSALATGIVKSTTTTGALTIAVASDFPTLNQNTSGTAASVTGTNVVTNTNLAQMATLTLKGNNTGGTANAADLTVSQVNTMLGALSNPMTTLGDIIYENATPAVARLAGNTTTTINFLAQTGTGSASAAPAWTAFTAPTVQTFLTIPSISAATGIYFTVSSANATVGATYTNNGITFTVLSTIASGTTLYTSRSGGSTLSGTTLTKASGTGDSSITYSVAQAMGTYTLPSSPRAPLYLKVSVLGGGGGGGGSGSTAGAGSNGLTSVFGTALLVCGGGSGGTYTGSTGGTPGTGGTASLGSGPTGIAQTGNASNATGGGTSGPGSTGAAGPFGGAGASGGGSTGGGTAGSAAAANSGAGGGGAGSATFGGTGGGSGGYVEALIGSPSGTYFYTVGIGGVGGTIGTSGGVGGAGASGIVLVEEFYQ